MHCSRREKHGSSLAMPTWWLHNLKQPNDGGGKCRRGKMHINVHRPLKFYNPNILLKICIRLFFFCILANVLKKCINIKLRFATRCFTSSSLDTTVVCLLISVPVKFQKIILNIEIIERVKILRPRLKTEVCVYLTNKTSEWMYCEQYIYRLWKKINKYRPTQ